MNSRSETSTPCPGQPFPWSSDHQLYQWREQNKSFVGTKYVFCRDKSMAKNTCLSRQKICLKNTVSTNIILSRQKTCFVATNTCVVETKMIIVAAPANDIRVAAHIPRESLKRLIKPSQAIYSETPNGGTLKHQRKNIWQISQWYPKVSDPWVQWPLVVVLLWYNRNVKPWLTYVGAHTRCRTLSFSKWQHANRRVGGNHPWQRYHFWLVSLFEQLNEIFLLKCSHSR